MKYCTTGKEKTFLSFFLKLNQIILVVLACAVLTTQTTSITLEKNITCDALVDCSTINLEPWRLVQDKVRDTVVQVFSQIAQFDWIQPYCTPNQGTARGSGFFINENGEIITNHHVIDQAVAVWVQIPSFGKRPIKVSVVGTCPDKDLALLRLNDADLKLVKKTIGRVPYLPLGDSDTIRRAEEALALGYPLGQESLKSTTGIISGMQVVSVVDKPQSSMLAPDRQLRIQISVPINPGSSGGPLLNVNGEVIGINSSGFTEAQNVGYAIPINDFKIILQDLYSMPIIKKPCLGLVSTQGGSDNLAAFLGNPLPGGYCVIKVIKNSPLEQAGVKSDDMIYEVNGNRLDIYGEMSVSWSEDKVSITDYINRLAVGEEVELVVYSHGKRKELTITVDRAEHLPIRKIYQWHETIDYEVFAGMVIMPLTMNHIELMGKEVPGLMRYENSNTEPVLLITHIFLNSELAYSRTVSPGFTLNEVNGEPIKTLEDFRDAIKKSIETGMIVLKVSDQITCASDNIPVVLPLQSTLEETIQLSQMYHYPLSDTVNELINMLQ